MHKRNLLLYVSFILAIFLITSCNGSQTKITRNEKPNLHGDDPAPNGDSSQTESDLIKSMLHNPRYISAGSTSSFVITQDGKLFTLGSNSDGQLGLGNEDNKNTLTQVGTNTDWQSISAGISHTLAIKTNGTLWTWGSNSEGELGLDKDKDDKNTPTQVGTDGDWKSISTGYYHSVALKTDGTLWVWGSNSRGELGLGNEDDKNTPTQVGVDTKWKSISTGYYHSVALKTDGTLWTWGGGDSGRLGLGNTDNKNTPTRVGTGTNWQSASTGPYYGFAIKTDGTLWGWGGNYGGDMLCLGDSYSKTSEILNPTQVGTNIDWKSVFPGGGQTFVIKKDNSLWGCGNNRLLPRITKNKNIPQKISTNKP